MGQQKQLIEINFKVERVKSTEWRLKQERYLLDPTAAKDSAPSPYDYKWDVPITWITSADTTAESQVWLGSEDPFVLVNAPSGTDWVKFNVGQFGYYRVNYPEKEWLQFGKLLQNSHETLSTKDRANLINDAFSLAESGHLEYSIPMSMTKYLKKERSLIPWETAYDKLIALKSWLQDTKTYPLLRKVSVQ
jgi:glutamyl aminopeptidase